MMVPISIETGGQLILASLHLPHFLRTSPLGVVFIAGPATNRCGPHRIHHQIATKLAGQGFTSIRFDFRGRGESSGPEQDLTVRTMIEDGQAAIQRILEETPDVTEVVLVANCLGCVAGLRLMERFPFIIGGVFSAATQFEERQNVRGFLTEARHSLEIYRRKLGSARTWSRLLRRDLDLAAVLRAVGNQSSRKYRKVRSNSNEQGAGCNQHYSHKRGVFIWGSRDPGLSECAFYDNFFSTRRWTYSSLIIDGADRSFSRETYREQLTDAVCVWVKQLESGTAAPRHQRIGS